MWGALILLLVTIYPGFWLMIHYNTAFALVALVSLDGVVKVGIFLGGTVDDGRSVPGHHPRQRHGDWL